MTQPKTISRRAFLLLSGAAVCVTALPIKLPTVFSAAIDSSGPDLIVGRALGAVPVYAQPGASSAVVGRVWPDSMTPIRDQTAGWYAVDEGYMRRSDLQPMISYTPPATLPVECLPAAVTVTAPVAVVRGWVAGQAPPVTRIGYGGTLWAVDRLLDDSGHVWYGVAAGQDEAPLGWTRASLWSAVPTSSAPAQQASRELMLDRLQRLVVAREGDQTVFSVPAIVPQWAKASRVSLDGRVMVGRVGDYNGVPWCLTAADTLLHGAYWHNDFGKTADCSGWQVSPWAARWLVDWLPDGAPVRVV